MFRNAIALLRSTRTTLFAGTATVLVLASPALPAQTFVNEWPHTSSDLQPDPAVKFGKLPNGMHYAIMKNNTPTGAVSLRLRIAAGSLQENDAQQGIAHLLEHMAFRGSKKVADGEVVHILERIGLQFGADTNAFTSHTQTVYKFDLPHSDAASVNSGLLLLREIASELNITDAALKTERGVVLSELRLRDTPQSRADDNELLSMLPGQRAPLRMPIGKADIVANADAALVRSYYQAYYQPQRATLVVTGNIDPRAIEKKIAADFGNWRAPKNAVQDPDLGSVKAPLQATQIYTEPGLPTQISIDWSKPYEAKSATRATEYEDTVRSVGTAILNQRFQQAALRNEAPFTNARVVHIDNMMHSARVASIGIDTTPEQWSKSLQAAQRIVNTVLAQGVTQDEVERIAAGFRTSMQTAVAGAGTRRTPTLADNLVNSLNSYEVFLSPQQANDEVVAALKDLKAATVTASLQKTLSGNGPLVYMATSILVPNGEATLAAAYKDALNAAGDDQAQATTAWPYTHFGEAGVVTARQKLDDLNTTLVTFKNGVRVTVKPTQFSAGQVEITARVGGGRLALDKTKPNATFLANALTTGGLKAIDYPTMQRALADKTYSLAPGLNDSFIALSGRTTPGDLDTQLQVMTAYLREPALRAGAIEHLRNSIIAQLPQLDAEPLSSLMVRVPGMLRGNDPRWLFPTLEQVQQANADDMKAWLLPMLNGGPLQVAIVGDVDVERAIQAAAATLGTLAPRPAPSLQLSPDHMVSFPAAVSAPLALQHTGGKDQAAAFIAWPAPDRRANFDEAADLQILTGIMQARLIDTMRTRTGSSYTANVAYDASWALKGFGAIQAVSDVKPAQTQVFYDAVKTIVSDLRNNAVSQDEFSRAQRPALANLAKARQTNGYFAQQLVSPEVDVQAMQWLRTQPALIEAVTPQRVQRAAQKYLQDDKAWKAVMLPTAGN